MMDIRKLFAEGLGTALLIIAVVGSGIMAERLSGGNVGVALLANAIATGAALYVLITVFGPISGAQFNPAVGLWLTITGKQTVAQTVSFGAVQVVGGIAGAIIANVMFDLPALQISEKMRGGSGQWLGEAVATFGLILTIAGTLRHRPDGVAAAVAFVYYRSLLVYLIHLLRQPGGDCGPDVLGHICGHSACVGSALYCRPTSWYGGGNRRVAASGRAKSLTASQGCGGVFRAQAMKRAHETRHHMMAFSKLFRVALCAGACASFSTWARADLVLKRELDTRSDMSCTVETAFGNFVTDALRKRHNVDVGLVNCAIIRGNTIYTAGTTFGEAQVAAELAPEQTLALIEVTGTQLLDALEQAVATLPAASSSFPQISGIRMEIDLRKPAGARINRLTVNGTALDFARVYKVATTEVLAAGGEGYAAFKDAKRIDVPQTTIAADVSAFLQDKGVNDVKVLGRIKQR